MDPLFPDLLRAASCCPQGIFFEGRWPLAESWVAIVGARSARRSSLQFAHDFAGQCARRGNVVVSGGAFGIDAAAHWGALAHDGVTCAVLGSGLDCLYPSSHKSLFYEIANSGALISPYDHDAKPLPWRFVRRNEIIAALSTTVVVVEGEFSSGARHTARAALAHGRSLLALPGSPLTDSLLAQGAKEAFLAQGGACREQPAPVKKTTMPVSSRHAQVVLERLRTGGAMGGDQLAEELQLEIRVVTRALAELTLDNLVLLVPGQRYSVAKRGA